MPFALAPAAEAEGYRLEGHDVVSSTNALALERARAGDAGKLWVVSKKQESGRGRRGRAWETPQGNLAATLLLLHEGEMRLAATLGFVAGLALSEALESSLPGSGVALVADGADGPGARFTLKWPNDVLAGGAKLAGILLESALMPQGAAIAIGIGVNVAAHPQDLPYPATSLRALGSDRDADDLFLALSDTWCRVFREWDEGRGLGLIRRRWLARAAGLGGAVAVRLDGTVVGGTFEDIDEDCQFVIRTTAGNRVCIAAGDVHFGAVASASAA